MKKIIVSLILTSLMLTSCGENNMMDNGKPTVGVCLYKYDDTYISTVRQALEKQAEGKLNLLLNDGKGDQGTQNDQIDLLIEKKVDALLVNIVDVGASQTVVNKAKSADIPIIFFNREPSEDVLKSYSKARFVGTNAKDAGVIQGEIITKNWNNGRYDNNNDNIMQYVMLKGEPDNPEAVARSEWSIKTVEENGIKTEQLGMQICNWDTELASRATEAWISKFGDEIEFIIANNDGMAQGAIAALQSAGYNKGDESKFIPVVGVDATDAARELIKKGYMTGTVLQDGEAMADVLFRISDNISNGLDFLDGTNLKYDDSGLAIRIPYKAYNGE